MVDLSVASTYYTGQFNINFAFDNGTDARYLSEFFHVDHNSSQAPLTWPADGASQVSLISEPSTTTVSTTAVSTLFSSQLSSSPSSQLGSTPSSTTQAASLKGGAIAGISVGSIILGSSILILIAILSIRRSRRTRKRSQANSSAMPKAAERAGQDEEWRGLSVQQMTPRELPTAEIRTELPVHRIR